MINDHTVKRRLRFVHKGKKEEGTVIKGKREDRNKGKEKPVIKGRTVSKGRGRTSHKRGRERTKRKNR